MHAAHLGIAVFIIGVTLVGGYETERDVRMEIGDTVEVGGYTFRFNGAKKSRAPTTWLISAIWMCCAMVKRFAAWNRRNEPIPLQAWP